MFILIFLFYFVSKRYYLFWVLVKRKLVSGLKIYIIIMKFNYNIEFVILLFLYYNVKERYNFKGRRVIFLGVLMNKLIFFFSNLY